ncbi:MAG TPA: 16S rRNA (cytosine(967)-C(5))-methyltransferase RsmB [Pyrinomonadaceae bacterium]
MKISPARVAAFEILQRIQTERSFSSVLLPAFEAKLSEVDRGLCHELTLGVLRRQIYLDRLIDHFASAKKLDAAVRVSLRLGIYQLLFLHKIPAYSAINDSVNLVHRARKSSAKGMVNAVLRRISEGVPELEFSDNIERLAVETSHPVWLVEKWIADFGKAEGEAIASANNQLPRIAFRFTNRQSPPPENLNRSKFVEGCYFAESIDGKLRTAAERGEIYFQDEASQLVGQIVAADIGSAFLDVCAAPGGKTTQVASRAGSEQLIVAGDLHSFRVRTLRETCERYVAGRVQIARYDAEHALPFADLTFDTVLVDAPCSGTGTIRHNPEIRYFLDPGDFDELSRKQRSILANASKLVRRGGRLIYSTCSLQIEENEDVCTAFLKETGDFAQVTPSVPAEFVTERGFARTFPHRDDTDGFFIAEFRRFVSPGSKFRVQAKSARLSH